mgnify:FL=1|tara:strand:- start:170 stop:421 length:252 start_codon:yes stop_codon:yes gene_type:complete
MKKQLTENQKQAIKIFNNRVEDSDFFESDGGDYVSTKELINSLVNNGWSESQAEGTIGSLTGIILHSTGNNEWFLEYYDKEEV